MKYYRSLHFTIVYAYIYMYVCMYIYIYIYPPISYSGVKILKPVASRINDALNISECHICP